MNTGLSNVGPNPGKKPESPTLGHGGSTLTASVEISLDQARDLILRLIPSATDFFDYLASVTMSARIVLSHEAAPVLTRHGDFKDTSGPFVTIISKDSSDHDFDILSFSLDETSQCAVLRSRNGGTGGETRIEPTEIHTWFADAENNRALIEFFNEELNRKPQEAQARYLTAHAEQSLVGFINPIDHYPAEVMPILEKPAGFACPVFKERGAKPQYYPISSRTSFVPLSAGLSNSALPFNPETDRLFAASPSELIFYDRSLHSALCTAICLAAEADAGSDGLRRVSIFSVASGDIGLHLRVLQAYYREWTSGNSEDEGSLKYISDHYMRNERKLVSDDFAPEDASLIPETLEELLNLTQFPDLKPFDTSTFPLVSVKSDPGAFIRRWPEDFR
jgi:hypothetical protein